MPNFSGSWTLRQQMQAKGASIWPATPGAPTIGTATAGINNCGSVTFTAPVCTGYPAGITSYRVISTPGCFTNTGASSPIVVSGLTNASNYTFKVQATNSIGYGPLSAASNSITASVPSCQTYTSAGTYTWVAPSGVTSIAYLLVGAGGNGGITRNAGCIFIGGSGGGGGATAYRNSYSVTPGCSYSVVLSNTSNTYFVSTCAGYVTAGNTGGCTYPSTVAGGTYGGSVTAGYNGGVGGNMGQTYTCSQPSGGGGGAAAGYSATGVQGGGENNNGTAGTGGGGGSGAGGSRCVSQRGGGGGGGIGLYGSGSNGSGGITQGGGGGGGSSGTSGATSTLSGGNGGAYGGGGGGAGWNGSAGTRGAPAVRIVWYSATRGTPSFPSTNVGA